MRRLLLAGVMGAALAAPIITSAMAQEVPVDPNGFSPYNTHGTLNENIQTSTIRQAPSLGLSSIYGLNPCSLGASAGVTTPLFGIAGAISTTDKGCETRNTAALAITGLKDEVAAREIMCDLPEFRNAVKQIGKPCLVDQGQAVAPTASAQPIVQPVAAQAPVAAQQAVAKETMSPDAPTWCHTPGLMLSSYPECTNPTARAATQEMKQEIRRKPVKQVVAPTSTKEQPAAEQQPADTAPEVRTTQDTVASSKPVRRPVPSPETHGLVVASASICAVRLYAPGCPAPGQQNVAVAQQHPAPQNVAVARVIEHPTPTPVVQKAPMVAAICGVKLYAPGCATPGASTVEDQPKPRLTAER